MAFKRRTKHWVTFYSPGSIVSNHWDRAYDKPVVASEVEWPKEAYAFSIHRRNDIIEEGTVYRSKALQVGRTYYHPDSRIESLDDVRFLSPKNKVLINNMESNKWSHVIWSRWGNWPQPFDATKSCILPGG